MTAGAGSGPNRAAATPPPAWAWPRVTCWPADPDAVMLVMPADHVIGPHETFRGKPSGRAAELVSERLPATGALSASPPRHPATGYGYIQRGESTPWAVTSQGHHVVTAFHEKPDRATAENVHRHRRDLLELRHLHLAG